MNQYDRVPDGWPDAHILVDFFKVMQIPETDEPGDWQELEDDESPYAEEMWDSIWPYTVWLGKVGGKRYLIRQGWKGRGSEDDVYDYSEVQP